jgi:16S rRNA processing protein RimM
MQDGRVLLGVVVGVHGVKGAVKLRSHTADPADIAAYGPLVAEDGRSFHIKILGLAKGNVVASFSGIGDRDAAEGLVGLKLYAFRTALPEPDDEDTFYHADLVGLKAERSDGAVYGRVKAVANFGAGDLLEIALAEGGKTVFLPFTKASVPLVEVKAGRVVVDPPLEVQGGEDAEGEER